MVRGVLTQLRLLVPLVIIAQDWPGALVAARAQQLGVAGACFPRRYHELIKPKSGQRWFPVTPPRGLNPPSGSVYVISGNCLFLESMLDRFPGGSPLILQVTPSEKDGTLFGRDTSARLITLARKRALQFVRRHGCTGEVLGEDTIGVATSGRFVFGFRGLSFSGLDPTAFVEHDVGHYLGGDTDPVETFSRHALPPLEGKDVPRGQLALRRGVLRHLGVVRPEGLFPVHNPSARVYCPLYRAPARLAVRPLALKEMLRVYSVPSEFHDMAWGSQALGFPFCHCPSADMFVAVFRHLWDAGTVEKGRDLRTGSTADQSTGDSARDDAYPVEQPTSVKEEKVQVLGREKPRTGAASADDVDLAMTADKPETQDTSAEDVPSLLGPDVQSDSSSDVSFPSLVTREESSCNGASWMDFEGDGTATTCSDTLTEPSSDWTFDFLCPIGAPESGEVDSLTDNDSWESAASEQTWLQGSAGRGNGGAGRGGD